MPHLPHELAGVLDGPTLWVACKNLGPWWAILLIEHDRDSLHLPAHGTHDTAGVFAGAGGIAEGWPTPNLLYSRRPRTPHTGRGHAMRPHAALTRGVQEVPAHWQEVASVNVIGSSADEQHAQQLRPRRTRPRKRCYMSR